jgi:hypothetical protein
VKLDTEVTLDRDGTTANDLCTSNNALANCRATEFWLLEFPRNDTATGSHRNQNMAAFQRPEKRRAPAKACEDNHYSRKIHILGFAIDRRTIRAMYTAHA